jgi:hypothetical protein
MLIMILDIWGMIFGVAGAILVGKKIRWGFISFTTGGIGHMLLGLLQGNYGLMITCILFIIIDIYYFIQWSRNEG